MTSANQVSETVVDAGRKGPDPIVGFKPNRSSDILLEAFSNVGNYCMFCSAKSGSNDMILCQCGDFMCTSCFLEKAPCNENKQAGVADAQEMARDKRTTAVSKSRVTTADFETTALTSELINLDGEIHTLEIRFESLRN